MKKRYLGLQKKFFLLFLAAILLSTFLVGICAYFISLSILKEKVSDSYRANLDFVASTVEHELSRIEQISNYLYVDSEVKELLLAGDHGSYEAAKRRDSIERTLNALVMTSDFHAYRLILMKSGDEVLFSYSPSGSTGIYDFDQEKINGLFARTPRTFQLEKCGENLYKSYLEPEYLLVSVRQVLDSNYSTEIGQAFLSLSSDVFSGDLGAYDAGADGRLYILDRDNRIVNAPVGTKDPLVERFLAQNPEGTTRTELDGALLFYEPVGAYGWKIVGTIPIGGLTRDSRVILLVILLGLLGGTALSLILWHFLSSRIYRPLNELKKAVREVEGGNLRATAPVISRDEIGELSQNFNRMVAQINELFEKVVDEQARLKDAQYRALRAQINPHFLYNTLSSIRWMAMIQKADNIKTMVDTLVRLLRNSTRKDSAGVTVQDEISAVRDYVFLQKLAYGCKFDVAWNVPEELGSCSCIGFLFQPIVENAIFHGIEPKQSSGLITISGKFGTLGGRECLVFEIRDDGVGMTREAMAEILEKDASNQYGLNGIGVANVNERLVLTYGPEYHLEYESEPGEYTSVTIRIPVERKEEPEHENGADCG